MKPQYRSWGELGDLVRPDLPRPTCRVKLVCGPPAAGKTTFVQQHAGPDDIVVDLDLIARDAGVDRGDVGQLLQRRNQQLAALANEPPSRLAWVILTAPSRCLREWWMQMLGVRPDDLTLLLPTHAELRLRITADPERRNALLQQFRSVDDWFAQERDNDPGITRRGTTDDGFPTDPLHPWNLR